MPREIDPFSEEADDIARLANMALLAALVIASFVAEFTYFRIWELAIALGVAGLVMVGSPWIYKTTGSLSVARESFLVSLFLFKLGESVFLGSVVSPGAMWFIAMPIIAILLGSVTSGICWLAVSTSGMLWLHSLYGGNVVFANSPVPMPEFLYTFSLVFLGFGLVAFVLMVDTSRKKAFRRLKSANQIIRELAIRDPLTGVFNRRYIWERMEKEERRALTNSGSFYICLIDLDRFKQINDTLGHPVGDIVLQAVARAVEGEIREDDCFGRYGGEEFILILKGHDALDPEAVAERIRRRVAALRLDHVPGLGQVTVSIGLAQFTLGEGFGKTINRADIALYTAKTLGRNRVVIAGAGKDKDKDKDTSTIPA